MNTGWESRLGLTAQQTSLVQAVAALNANNVKANPKGIEQKYKELTGRLIQKPNLFTQLKVLVGIGVLARSGPAEYCVDLQGVKERLVLKRAALQKELASQDVLIKSLDKGIKQFGYAQQVTYLPVQHYFKELGEKLEGSTSVYCKAAFPYLCFTPAVARAAGASEYCSALQDLAEEGAEIKYTCHFDMRYVFSLALAARNDKKKALAECRAVVSQLEHYATAYDNVGIRKVTSSPWLAFAILAPSDALFMALQPPSHPVSNGLIIRSAELVADVRSLFKAEYDNAKAVTMTELMRSLSQ